MTGKFMYEAVIQGDAANGVGHAGEPLACPASPDPRRVYPEARKEQQREAAVAEWVAENAVSNRDWNLLEMAVTQTKQSTEEFLIETKLQGSSRQI
jgi:hypothetical protein